MIKCEKCGIENEDGSKFCKSCGSVLHVEPIQSVNQINNNSTISTVKKIAMWIGIAILAFIAIVILINFVHDKREDSKIIELRNGCANNNAQSCYELGESDYSGYGMFNSEKKLYPDEIKEALAKGCQLGNKNACREAGYYLQGCDLQDGESCYLFAADIQKVQGVSGSASCAVEPTGYECKLAKSFGETDIKHYLNLACEYGYSQGCMSK